MGFTSHAAGVADVLLVGREAREPAGTQLAQSLVGNDIGTRVWQGDLLDLPAFMSSADVAVLSAGAPDLRALLMKASVFVLRAGGYAAVVAPCGGGTAPSLEQLQALTHDLPLEHVSDAWPALQAHGGAVAVMQVPAGYVLKRAFPQSPVLEGPVVRGFGRGSRQMGTPTANIDPAGLTSQLAALPKGVYFGWARLAAPAGWHADDGAAHKVVLNIGTRPTVSGGDSDVSVECFILHSFKGPAGTSHSGTEVSEFYGAQLKVVVTGFLRPEMRFPGLPALVSRIKMDTALARNMLDTQPHLAAKDLI